MLSVLRHYLPLRKALLVGSETLLLSVACWIALSSHLWMASPVTAHLLAEESKSLDEARWICGVSAFLVAILAQIAISFNELYDFRVSHSRQERAKRFVGSAGSAMALTTAAVVLAHAWNLGRVLDFPGLPLVQRVVMLTVGLGVGFAFLYPWRTIFHWAQRKVKANERLLVVGRGRMARTIVSELAGRDDSGFEVAGLLSAIPGFQEQAPSIEGGLPRWRGTDGRGGRRAHEGGNGNGGEQRAGLAPAATLLLSPDPETLAREESLPEGEEVKEGIYHLARRLDVDAIVVATDERRGGLPYEELLRCRLAGIVVEEGEALYERVTGKLAVESLRPSYLIFNQGFVTHPLAAFGKRSADIGLSVVGLIILWPAMLATALAVRLDSPGFVFFRQQRTGMNGKPFTLIKFRSMRADAEKLTGPVWASEDDPRITRVGKFIRKTRLDELPQLFNVLGGEMSLVGPRPERPVFVEELAGQIPYYDQRHLVKPGVTGWAQIKYPYGNTVEDALQKLQYDLFYIKSQSLIFDLSILFQTIKTVLLQRGT